jgi:hypothetical protein
VAIQAGLPGIVPTIVFKPRLVRSLVEIPFLPGDYHSGPSSSQYLNSLGLTCGVEVRKLRKPSHTGAAIAAKTLFDYQLSAADARALIAAGHDLNATDERGQTPLIKRM